ncbi:unnamed protein product [Acanthoscelides obtectus]|uniref:Uncharacterized protein n=1 Tax=Acanthoscelides obtectus TaxID=200917 RepID=A0A9P0KRV6_ACAOB|nr:unnamed protein product [Acanthoscelides obtectus]CAK1628218.1 hypothetical protein AOBTE_LOCUS5079 [Acanthoscelides obtectus]
MDRSEGKVHWVQTLKEFLKESRLATTQVERPKRGKKIKVAPGKAISAKYFEESSDNSEPEYMELSNGGCEQEAAKNPSNEELREEGNFSDELEADLHNQINFDCIQPGNFLLVKCACPNNILSDIEIRTPSLNGFILIKFCISI